jgi:hypothetical protein
MNIADDAAIGNVDFRAVGGGRERLEIGDWRLEIGVSSLLDS